MNIHLKIPHLIHSELKRQLEQIYQSYYTRHMKWPISWTIWYGDVNWILTATNHIIRVASYIALVGFGFEYISIKPGEHGRTHVFALGPKVLACSFISDVILKYISFYRGTSSQISVIPKSSFVSENLEIFDWNWQFLIQYSFLTSSVS